MKQKNESFQRGSDHQIPAQCISLDEVSLNQCKQEADDFLSELLKTTRQQAIEEIITELRDKESNQYLLIRALEQMRSN